MQFLDRKSNYRNYIRNLAGGEKVLHYFLIIKDLEQKLDLCLLYCKRAQEKVINKSLCITQRVVKIYKCHRVNVVL